MERMTPLEALQHPFILQGLPDKVLRHHNKLFSSQGSSDVIKQATLTDIQGFPKDKREVTIYDMVQEVKRDDAAFRQDACKQKRK